MKVQKLATMGVVCLAGALMVCADLQAQPGGGRGDGGGRGFGGRGGFGGPLALVGRQDVQEELQLTSAQQNQIETLEDELRPDFGGGRGGFGNFGEMSDEERQEAFAKMREEREKQQTEAAAKLKDILNTTQAKRLAELELQFALQRLRNDDQLAVLATYIDQDKLQASIGEPFEFETRGFGRGGGRGDRGGPGAGRRGGDQESSDDADTGGRRRRRGN